MKPPFAWSGPSWPGPSDQSHPLAIAARTMRQILVDERPPGGGGTRNAPPITTRWRADGRVGLVDVADLDGALAALAALSPERAEIVELRFMLGMTVEETAAATGIPERTVKRRWQSARARLLDYLNGPGDARLA